MTFRDAARGAVRRAASPVWRRLWIRVENRIAPAEQRIAALEAQTAGSSGPVRLARLVAGDPATARLDAFDSAWRQHVPALLAATTRSAAAADLTTALLRRVEALEAAQDQSRAEQAAVWRAVAGAGTAAGVTRQLRPCATLDAEAEVRLAFVGPGLAPPPGHVAVARDAAPGIDIVSAGTGLPVPPGRVAAIFADNFLGGLDARHWRQAVLPYWRTLLRVGGTLRIRMPDADALLRAVARGDLGAAGFWDNLAGPEDTVLHAADRLRVELEDAGFELTDPATAVIPDARMATEDGVPLLDINAVRR